MKHFAFALITYTLLVTAASAQTYTTLYSFSSHAGDPNDPINSGIIAQGRDGNLYSTAQDYWTRQPGSVFKITPAGILTVIHQFNGADGQAPVGGLTLAYGGNFYGTTELGGSFGNGTIFRISAGGKLDTLHNFTGGADGGSPWAPPIQGLDDNFYGTTVGGGSHDMGTVYRMTWSGAFKTLHAFNGYGRRQPVWSFARSHR